MKDTGNQRPSHEHHLAFSHFLPLWTEMETPFLLTFPVFGGSYLLPRESLSQGSLKWKPGGGAKGDQGAM